jgi:hypothetical protein
MQTASSSSLSPRFMLQDPVDPSEDLEGTPILLAAFDNGETFLHAYSHKGPAGEIAVVTRAAPKNGTEVVLEVTWPELPNRVFIRAEVHRRPLGLIARFHHDEEHVRDFLLRMAAGYSVDYHPRKHKRYCVRLPLGWRCFGEAELHEGVAEDLSAGGMLVVTGGLLPPSGEHVAVRLPAPAGQDLIITGTVCHARRRYQDSAFGMKFDHRESAEQRRLRQLLRGFASRGVVLLSSKH